MDDPARTEATKAVLYVIESYLKGRRKSTMLALLGDTEDMCRALRDPVNAPKVAFLGLTGQVEAIRELALQCDTLVDIRDDILTKRSAFFDARKEGMEEGRRAIAVTCLKKGLSPKDISELDRLDDR